MLGNPGFVAESKNRFAEGSAVREYVFASRGLTLSIAEPYPSVAKPRIVLHAQLYRAASPEYYLRYIGPGPELQPIPRAHQKEEDH